MSLVYDILALRSNSEGIYLDLGLRLQAQINLTFLPFTNPSFVSSSLLVLTMGIHSAMHREIRLQGSEPP